MRFLFPPEEGADDLNPNRQRRCHGRGHRPCHSARLTPGPPGAQSPRPAPAPPSAGASRPPGRALASVGTGGTGPGSSVPRGRGKRMRFLFPPGAVPEDQSPNRQPRSTCRGHRPCHGTPLPPGPGCQSPRPKPAPAGWGNAARFLLRPDRHALFPGSGRFSPRASKGHAFSALCQDDKAR